MVSYVPLLFSCLIISISSMIPIGYSLNSCGLKDYSQPTQTSDCKDDNDDGYKCCYIKSETKKFAYCSFVPGKVDKDIIEDFKESLEIEDLVVECNNQRKLSLNFVYFVTFIILLF